jgi:uncharacterized protein (DUF924 family)
MQPQPILHFWFTELTPKQHFAKDAALDEAIRTLRFELQHKAIIDALAATPTATPCWAAVPRRKSCHF